MRQTITIKYSVHHARRLGLLSCACGHPESNHFGLKPKPCVNCSCEDYAEKAKLGIIVARTPMKYRRGDVFVAHDGSLWECYSTLPETMKYMLIGRDAEYGHSVMTYTSEAEIDLDYQRIGRL